MAVPNSAFPAPTAKAVRAKCMTLTSALHSLGVAALCRQYECISAQKPTPLDPNWPYPRLKSERTLDCRRRSVSRGRSWRAGCGFPAPKRAAIFNLRSLGGSGRSRVSALTAAPSDPRSAPDKAKDFCDCPANDPFIDGAIRRAPFHLFEVHSQAFTAPAVSPATI
jgi:hypothetical protein